MSTCRELVGDFDLTERGPLLERTRRPKLSDGSQITTDTDTVGGYLTSGLSKSCAAEDRTERICQAQQNVRFIRLGLIPSPQSSLQAAEWYHR